MNNNWPFLTMPIKKAGLLDKFTSKKNKENAAIEINNLFAKNRNVQSASPSDIEKILEKYKLGFNRKLQDEMSCFYKAYLIYCLQDKKLSDDEIQDLRHLKNLFSLDDKTIEAIHDEQFKYTYRKSYKDIIADGEIRDEEKSFLSSLQNDLKLPDGIVQNIIKEEVSTYLQSKMDQAIEDRRLSPDEETEIQKIASNLGATLQYDEATKNLLDKFRLFWLIENGEVPSISVPINLQRGENCYFNTNAELYEYRKVTSRITYSGPVARIRIMKGLSWRIGDLKFHTASNDVFSKIDTGSLFLTNKRMLFAGPTKTMSIPLGKIINFNPYKDGVGIQKAAGKNQFFMFTYNNDIFFALLERAIRDVS